MSIFSTLKRPMADYVSGSELLYYFRKARMGEKGHLDPVALQKLIPREEGAGIQA